MNLSPRGFLAPVFLAAVVVLAACGGGGGGGGDAGTGVSTASSAPAPATGPGTGTGNVVVVIGDDDIGYWDQAIFKISEITLIGADGSHVLILDEMRIIDFLALETVNEVLADAVVPVNTYGKMRFAVDAIRLRKLAVPTDPDSAEIDAADVAVPSGKADVNPQGDAFTVGEDEDLVIEIEVPLEKALKFHSTGSGKWQFRPVIFAKVLTVDDPGGLIRVFGNDVRMDDAGPLLETDTEDAFDLCELGGIAEVNPLQDDGRCIRIVVDEDTCFFALVVVEGRQVLQQVGADAVTDEDAATVYGFIDPAADGLTIAAEIVAIGGTDAYVILEGEATGTAQGDPPGFPLDKGDGGDEMDVVLIKGSKLYDRTGVPADPAGIKAGVDVEAEGHLVKSDKLGVSDRLDAFVGFVGDDPGDEVEGILDVIDLGNRELTLVDKDDLVTEFCVRYDDDTLFYRVGGDSDDGLIESGEVSVGELEEGVEVEASGTFTGDCLQADQIILEVGLAV